MVSRMCLRSNLGGEEAAGEAEVFSLPAEPQTDPLGALTFQKECVWAWEREMGEGRVCEYYTQLVHYEPSQW